MSLYEKSVRLLMRDMIADRDIVSGKVFDKASVLFWFTHKYPKVKEGTISAHLSLLCVNSLNRIHHNPKTTGEDDLLFKLDATHFRLYEPQNDPTPIYKIESASAIFDVSNDEATVNNPDIIETAATTEFAYERDLKNFLAKNLTLIEPGLRIYEEEGITGIEFPVGSRSIDILAVDKNNDYMVIELKVSRGYDRVVGQLLRYMGWVEKHHADLGQKVRGVIIAKEISEDLLLACSKLGDVVLYEYDLSVTLKKAG